MHRFFAVLSMLGVVSFTAVAVNAQAKDDVAAKVKKLEKRVQAQDKQIAELKNNQKVLSSRQLGREEDRKLIKKMLSDAKTRSSNDFRVYWKDGIRLDTADKNLKLKFGGRLMYDFGWIDGSGIEKDLGTNLQDGAEARRARLYVGGSIYKDLEFKLQFDFAGGDADLKDAYLRVKKIPILGNLTVGHFKEPFSLEQLTSSKYITFMERSLADVFSPGRNAGIMVNNTLFNQRMTWAAGLFRPSSDSYGEDDVDGESAFTTRVTFLPWYADKGSKLLHLGAGYSYRTLKNQIRYRQRPEAHWISQRFTDTGHFDAQSANLFGAEMAFVYGPFSVQGEYSNATINSPSTGDPSLNGFYVQGSYFLTGEHRKYKKSSGSFSRVKPNKNFRQDGGWGAWEIAARYSYLDFDEANLPDTARAMQDATVGLNWYLTPNVRIMWNYIRACVESRDVSNSADIFMTRLQVDF